MGKTLRMLWLAMAVAVAGGVLCAQGEEEGGIRIDGTTIEMSFADEGFSGIVDDTYRDRYTNAKAQIMAWNGVDAFGEIEVLENDEEWPWLEYIPSVSNPVMRLAFVRPDGGEDASTNTVGYVKRTVPAGKWQIVSIPYGNIAADDGRYQFGETQVANDLPQGSSVLFWSGEKQGWSGGGKSAKGWAPAQSHHTLGTGEAFFVRNPSDSDLEVTPAGEVPEEGKRSRDYAAGNKWSIMASMYPVPVKFGDTELAGQLPQGSAVLFWDAGKQGWSGGAKGAKGWAANVANHEVGTGEGFFLKSASEGTWVQEKPYGWE